jgi:hypothetical protein
MKPKWRHIALPINLMGSRAEGISIVIGFLQPVQSKCGIFDTSTLYDEVIIALSTFYIPPFQTDTLPFFG